MLIYQLKVPGFNPVQAGSEASVMLTRGPTYHEIKLKLTNGGIAVTDAVAAAQFGKVSLLINGKPFYFISMKHLIDTLIKYQGFAFVNGEITIQLARSNMRTPSGEENLAWGTGNIDTFELKVEIKATATNPTISAVALVSPEKRDLGAIIEVREYSFSTATAGVFEIRDLPRTNGDLVALHFDNANIDEVVVDINGFSAVEGDMVAYLNRLTERAGRAPQAGYAHIDFLVRNRLDDVLPLRNLNDFTVKLDMSASGSVPIVMETLNVPLAKQEAAAKSLMKAKK